VIALDTNVLVRFLVKDDEEQTERARRVVERAFERGQAVYISEIVLCETVWVLRSAYRFPRLQIVGILGFLMRARQLAFPSRERLLLTLDAYRTGRGDFADYLIRSDALGAGCEQVATFDGDLQNEESFLAP
jgi:predicted nucleic-acid-binding protein